MVRILGLDPGSRITGYGVVDADRRGVRYVASGCIRVGNGDLSGRVSAELGSKTVIVAKGTLIVTGNIRTPVLKQ